MTDRAIFEVTGVDRVSFLQGMVTNDMRKLSHGAVYAALLTPQGKYLADFILVEQGETILLDIDASIAGPTIKRLLMYKLRADVAIVPSTLSVFRGTQKAPEGAVADPRHPALGWRLYGARSGDDGTDFDAIRVAHCIPETGLELTADSFILEYGFERLSGVDFRKGCYVGQEVTARMKHKTELRKGLTTVTVAGDAEFGAQITSNDKVAGQILTRSGDHALAYLRFDRVGDEMLCEGAKVTLNTVNEG
ncbi:aminomethyltransferase [Thioclava sp. SK-1]|uniref:CAF17-like 4Fe-4S cluster assembly/insertion protein YgfZ n=1 Tax=Thioclava sp. SK-1 TaxID=1889770 RepID=UPI000824A035|nr:folate-binding protein YgfZ [Thioclava sp. SK-1]OCX64574.1 aminomethyltransferase [Thioclava sp. SK-1]